MKLENQNEEITIIDDESMGDKRDQRNKALDFINMQLRALKREFEHFSEQMPYFDFEKGVCLDDICDLSIITPSTKKFKYNAESAKQKIRCIGDIDAIIKYDKPVSVQSMMDFVVNYEGEFDYVSSIMEIQEYYISCMHLPLLYILKGSKRFVSTNEWVFAYKERNILGTLKKIDRLRNKNKLSYKSLTKKSMRDIDLKKKISKVFAYECKKVYDKNAVEINDRREIIFNKKHKITSTKEKESIEHLRNYRGIFPSLFNCKTNLKYNFIAPKRNSQHTSHTTTLRKISPDSLKIKDARRLVEHQNTIKKMSYGMRFKKDVSDRTLYPGFPSADQRYDHRNR